MQKKIGVSSVPVSTHASLVSAKALHHLLIFGMNKLVLVFNTDVPLSSNSLVLEMDIDKDFTEWAVSWGVKLNGVATHRFPGRGLGIIAEKKLEAGDTLMTAPISVLRTAQTVPKSISKPVGAITVNGLLATELAMDTSEVRAPWRAVLPTKDDFDESMPLMWHPSLQGLLPPASLTLLQKQKKKISLDWSAVSTAFPVLSYDLYLYNWLIVSTRTFYYTAPKTKATTKKLLDHDDCLALIPVADNFNHADVGCEVTFSPSGYKIRTGHQIDIGEEIYISYGQHSNDFLLAEYGFILEENRWDEIYLDEVILPLFSDQQKQKLEEAGFWGKFALDKDGVCYRTQVALRLLCMPVNIWQGIVATGLEDKDDYQMAADRILLKALKSYLDEVEEKSKQVEALECGLLSQREILSRRWKQIRLLLTASMRRIEA